MWASTYKNANRRLVAWGTIFGAFPGLDIVHRAGKVHSNVDPLSRLLRVPLHQSPAIDNTQPIKDALPNQPIRVWEPQTEEPAVKATFAATTWEDILEASPKDPSAWLITRGRVKRLKERDPGEAEDEQGEDKDTDQELVEGQKKREVQSSTEDKPG